jgi:hypothetical protein
MVSPKVVVLVTMERISPKGKYIIQSSWYLIADSRQVLTSLILKRVF